MKRFLFVLAFGVLLTAYVAADTRIIPPVGQSKASADAAYVNADGDSGMTNTFDFSLAILIAKAATADTHVATRVFGDGRWSQLAVANTFTKANIFNGDVTLGDAIGDTVTINAGTETYASDYAASFALDALFAAPSGLFRFTASSVEIVGGLEAQENTELGDAVGDTLTIKAGTVTHPNVTTINVDAAMTVDAKGQTITYDFSGGGEGIFNGPLEVAGTTGIAYNPVGDVDVDIFNVEVTGAPKCFWDNSEARFSFVKGLIVPDLGAGATPDASAIIDMTSTTQGLGLPNMTTTQRDAITLPKTGLVVFDTTAGMSVENVGTPASPVWAGVGGGGPTIKSGVEASGSFSGNPLTATVTFGTAFSDANYSVSIIGVDERTWTVDSQAAGSFVINTNAAQSITANVSWTAIAHFDP